MKHIHIDFETFSSVDIKKSGLYKYCESPDFEILLMAYHTEEQGLGIVDLYSGEKIPKNVLSALNDPTYTVCAHNATFERICLRTVGIEIPASRFYCTQIHSLYCGLPSSLDQVSKALNLGDKSKDTSGKALIRYFTVPRKATKNNNQTRNYPENNLEKWESFKGYCKQDVVAEMEIARILSVSPIPKIEIRNYINDQKINDTGIQCDTVFCSKMQKHDEKLKHYVKQDLINITNLENPNSTPQILGWINSRIGINKIKSLAKENMPYAYECISESAVEGILKNVLDLKSLLSSTAAKKYEAVDSCACSDNRARGLFQFYGANRTGRWAGRLVQLQNLKRNKSSEIEKVRSLYNSLDIEDILMINDYSKISEDCAELVRSSFVAPSGKKLLVSDFSAIEARVIAWLAGESWRLKVFEGDGKIYEASASKMFNIPMDKITPELRTIGKVAELALGFQGGVGALEKMGGEKLGLSKKQMADIVDKWRKANIKIAKLWDAVNSAAIVSVRMRKKVVLNEFRMITFECFDDYLTIKLPSGRKLHYREPSVTTNRFGGLGVVYKGTENGVWCKIESYGGKFVENMVQAIARDVLAEAINNLLEEEQKVVMHVHDEAVLETDLEDTKEIDSIMSREIPWAKGLRMEAKSFISEYYKKD